MSVVTKVFSTCEVGVLLYLQWNLFWFFITQKKQRLQQEGKSDFSQKDKAVIGWILCVLFINSIDFLSYVVVEILI